MKIIFVNSFTFYPVGACKYVNHFRTNLASIEEIKAKDLSFGVV
jgi:hypothetical protein